LVRCFPSGLGETQTEVEKLTDPKIVAISQELDLLIAVYQKGLTIINVRTFLS
jgi:Spo0E like sporulation regulatory protein